MPVLRTLADCNPFFLSEVDVPSKASLKLHEPEASVTLAVAYAVLVPVSKFSAVVTANAAATLASVVELVALSTTGFDTGESIF